jgi:hypothetical protein
MRNERRLKWTAAVLFLLVGGAVGCNSKQKIMDASLVSMTHSSIPEGARLQDQGPVSGRFCSNLTGDKGTLGLFDEAIKNAQSTSGVDFIANATFWNESGCVSVEGTGQKLLR